MLRLVTLVSVRCSCQPVIIGDLLLPAVSRHKMHRTCFAETLCPPGGGDYHLQPVKNNTTPYTFIDIRLIYNCNTFKDMQHLTGNRKSFAFVGNHPQLLLQCALP